MKMYKEPLILVIAFIASIIVLVYITVAPAKDTSATVDGKTPIQLLIGEDAVKQNIKAKQNANKAKETIENSKEPEDDTQKESQDIESIIKDNTPTPEINPDSGSGEISNLIPRLENGGENDGAQ